MDHSIIFVTIYMKIIITYNYENTLRHTDILPGTLLPLISNKRRDICFLEIYQILSEDTKLDTIFPTISHRYYNRSVYSNHTEIVNRHKRSIAPALLHRKTLFKIPRAIPTRSRSKHFHMIFHTSRGKNKFSFERRNDEQTSR